LPRAEYGRDAERHHQADRGLQRLKLAAAFAIPDLDREVKWHCKYARQNGIHVSPTFMIDGVVQADMSSGDAVADWAKRLLQH
jgi:hypothetical protein